MSEKKKRHNNLGEYIILSRGISGFKWRLFFADNALAVLRGHHFEISCRALLPYVLVLPRPVVPNVDDVETI